MRYLGTPLGRYTPFIVYAADAPSYPATQMWGETSAPSGRRPWLMRAKEGADQIAGSLIVVSGGSKAPEDDSEGFSSDQPEICVSGCLGMRGELGERFAEGTIAALIGPEDRVTMLLYVSRTEAADCLATVRSAGFEVIETVDVTPGVDSAYALCLGTGKMLSAYQFLTQVWPCEPFFLHANRGPECRLENAAKDAALKRAKPELAALRLLGEIRRTPDTAEEILGRGYVHVGLTDPEQRSLRIARQDPDISSMEVVLSRTALGMGLALFDAGSIRELVSRDEYFADPKMYNRCMSLPLGWAKVV